MEIVDASPLDQWSFGGGTALMLQIGHRESHDIDLFITDPEYLPYLNPETQGFDLSIAPSSYDSDGTSSLKLVFDNVGEIDIICCGTLLPDAVRQREVRGRVVDLETPAEIVAKKIYHRGAKLQPRDMFDLASVVRIYAEGYLAASLADILPQVRLALGVAKAYDPDVVQLVLDGLSVHPDFEPIRSSAHADTVAILERLSA